jgi:CubicO group peptidase (beta-lactamase class C family)
MQGWSMNKSLMATFIGYQVDAGQLSLDDSVREMLQREGFSEKKLNQIAPNLSLEHLLSMSSGFDFSERYFPGDDVTAMLYQHGAMGYSAPLTGHINEPGREFRYSSGDINTAAMMWQQSLGSELYTDWLGPQFYCTAGPTQNGIGA